MVEAGHPGNHNRLNATLRRVMTARRLLARTLCRTSSRLGGLILAGKPYATSAEVAAAIDASGVIRLHA